MNNILAEICEAKHNHIAACKASRPESALRERASHVPAPRGFERALKEKTAQQHPALIAEIKRASPSKGLIRQDFNPAEHAQSYRDGGAACLSVLTDEPYFQGHNEFLTQAHEAVALPILRKDFMLDTYQVTEARAIGADCILLIMAALDDAQARELEAAAMELGMDVLVEVHDAQEAERALSHLRSTLLGVNNRNLKTLEVDLQTSINISDQIPDNYTIVCESGIKTHSDIVHMRAHNIHCFLVGESLMLQRNITAATQKLLGTHAGT